MATRDPEKMADRLAAETSACGSDALLVRVYFPGIEPAEMVEQIDAIGERVLPALRARLGWPAAPASGAP